VSSSNSAAYFCKDKEPKLFNKILATSDFRLVFKKRSLMIMIQYKNEKAKNIIKVDFKCYNRPMALKSLPISLHKAYLIKVACKKGKSCNIKFLQTV